MSGQSIPDLPLADTTWLTALARTLTRDPALADDLVQDTWMTVIRSKTPERSESRAWLAGVLRRLHLNSLRSVRRRSRRESAAARREATPSTGELVERTELQRTLAQCLLDLEEPFRSTLMFVAFEGLTPAQIAECEGVSASVVRYRIRKARELMRQQLEALGEGGWSHWYAALLPLAQLPLPHALGKSGAVKLISENPSLGATATVAPLPPALLILMNKSVWIAVAASTLAVLGMRELASREPTSEPMRVAVDLESSESSSTTAESLTSATGEGARESVTHPPLPMEEESGEPEITNVLTLRGSVQTPDGAIPSDPTVSFVPLLHDGSTRVTDLKSVTPDAQGRFEFEFESWEAGFVSAAAFGWGSVSVDPWGEGFNPLPARVIELEPIVLQTGATISGVVTRNGQPLERGVVRAALSSDEVLRSRESASLDYELGPNGVLLQLQAATSIDSEGRFELTGLQAGLDYKLVALPHSPFAPGVLGLPKSLQVPEVRDIPQESIVHEVYSPDPVGTRVRAPAFDVDLDWGMCVVQFVVTCEGQPVSLPGVRASFDPFDPRGQESDAKLDGLIMPRYGDEQGHIDLLLSAMDTYFLRFLTPGYRELDFEFNASDLPEDGVVEVQLERDLSATQLYLRFVGPTPAELAGTSVKLIFASAERGMEFSSSIPVHDGAARITVQAGFKAGFFELVPAEFEPDDSPIPLPYFKASIEYLSLEERLREGEVREMEVELKMGGRVEVSCAQRDLNLPAPKFEAIDKLGNSTELTFEGVEPGTVPSTFLLPGQYKVRQVGPAYLQNEVDVKIRERETTRVQFDLQPLAAQPSER